MITLCLLVYGFVSISNLIKSKLICSQVTAQTLAEVFILCVNWKIILSFNFILQALSITKLKHIITQQWFEL